MKKHRKENKRGEPYYQCPFCTCTFFHPSDLENHLNALGTTQWKHQNEFNKLHAWEFEYKKPKPEERTSKLTKASEHKEQTKLEEEY